MAVTGTLTAGSRALDDATPAPAAATVTLPVPTTPTPSAPAATVAPALLLDRSAPVRLQIPSIGVDSALMDLGLQPDGTMQVPPTGFPAGWYTGAPTPGEQGPAVLAGHVDWAGSPGVFHELRSVRPGAEVAISRADGTVATFRVSQVEQHDKDAFPTGLVYGNLDRAGLRLITCGGSFDEQASSYRDNIVVFADLVAVAPAG
ncbi:class F sortase [Rhodococcus sp. X156]|uniref:class F sortase n=1 Tax=Rhodococcus sp. X156 TaxID=2499145 RepID=UPI001F49AED6|nr:class F sortase [Rhodococcus sp. X156]